MPYRKLGDAALVRVGERIQRHPHRTVLRGDGPRKCVLVLFVAAYFHGVQHETERLRVLLALLPLRHRPRRLRIPQHCNARHTRERGLEIFEPLAGEDGGHVGYAGHIAPRIRKARDEPGANRIGHPHEYDRHRASGFFHRDRRVGGDTHEHIGLHRHELRGEGGKSVKRAILVTVLDDNVASLDVAELAQSLPEGLQSWGVRREGNGGEVADARHFGLLRSREGCHR